MAITAQMVKELRDQGMTIVYTTHYMEEAERLCDRVAIIDEGVTRTIPLAEPIDVFVLYWTAAVDVDGELEYPRDGVRIWLLESGKPEVYEGIYAAGFLDCVSRFRNSLLAWGLSRSFRSMSFRDARARRRR